MSRIYDNWEKLMAAVLKKEQLWQLFHEQSRSPSISSESSGFSFSFNLTSSLDDVPFSFSSPDWSASNQKEDDIAIKTAVATPSSSFVKDQSPVENLSPNKNVTITPPRKRNLRIQVPKPQLQQNGASCWPNVSPRMTSPAQSSRVHTRTGGGHSVSLTNWPDDAKHQTHPLPLPPEAFLNSRPNSAATSPTASLLSPERAENLKSPVTQWKRGRLIGRGAFGNVYVGFHSEKGEMCAMKEVKLSSDDANSKQGARMFEIEVTILSSLKHPNVVQYYGSETVGDYLYIYLEYVSGGSIYTIMQQYGKLGESAIRSYAQQILSGLAYIHSKSIVHRDIKGANILVDPTGRVKLSNFGIEKHIVGQSSLLMDSPYWMAPEVLLNPNVRNKAIDIWSLGCTIIEMATSKPPWSQYEGIAAMFKIGNSKERPAIPDHLSDEGKDFVMLCLQRNPLHRPTAAQLLEHPFVKSSSPLAKQKVRVSTFKGYPTVTIASTPEGIDHARRLHHLDLGGLASHSSRASKSNFHPSDIYTPRNISTPVSPVGSPLLHPRSPQHLNRHISPPPKANTRVSSSSSTPLIGGNVAIRYPHLNQSILPQESFRILPKHLPGISSPSYWDPNILQGASSDNHSHRKQFGRFANGQVNEQSALADRVFQQLLKAPVKLNPPSLDWNPSSPLTSHRVAGI
ncbi:hypothetical protein DH2020_031008 [Rehmannia glutinosa]|uniref:mitogen-activated protein kinase kinase kinase n=1 Tax=Rehmannia glutinosa TaxID=99300 RepID=A0ABR0VM44_REHGL